MEHAISWLVWYVQLTITIEAYPFIKLSVAIVAFLKNCENRKWDREREAFKCSFQEGVRVF